MAYGYTVFTTYLLKPVKWTGDTTGYGYGQAVHCNYIKSILLDTDNPNIEEIRFSFPYASDFKFLSNDIINGTGFTANELYLLVQMIDNSTYDNLSDVKPFADKWRMVNVTNQVTGYTSSATFYLTPINLTSVVFKVPLINYTSYPFYNLIYLNYPTTANGLSFGAETYFFGNVSTDIHADVYTTNLAISLPLNEFNSSSNLTWDGITRVAISEVGIYDINKNLVAIGKFNQPVEKDATIARTIQFAIDF